AAGDRFDRYVIEELLGEGGMAGVYRAFDPRLNRRVALKVLRVDSSRDPQSAADASGRILREARAAASLDHPNAVSIFDVGEVESQLYIAMELVQGRTLRAFVDDASVRWEVKLRWMVDAARALGAAHDKGLVHRDVKPENVMVRSDGVVKVVDFGIAKRVRVDVASSSVIDDARTHSIQGGIVGTPWYLSPEQLKGDAVDGRADQFAWAVTTYELLTGRLPWPKGVDGFQLVLSILNKMPDPPSAALPALPSIVDATIMKALAKAPGQRFESMEWAVSGLEALAMNSRRSWAEIPVGAMMKTDPAPALESAPIVPRVPVAAIPVTDEPTTLPSTKPPAQKRPVPWMLVGAALAGAAVVAFLGTRPSGSSPPGLAAVEAPSPAPASAPTTLIDSPPPRSSVPAAVAAYRSFQRAFRDADWNMAMTSLATASEKDPTMAAAHLRLAFMRSLESVDEGLVRSTFTQAVRNRATLDARDAALLDALAPYLQSDPSDPAETERRLGALHAARPGDAEIAYILGSARFDRGDLAPAADAFRDALAIDPDFALAWSSLGGCLSYMGTFDEARRDLDEALRRSRTATEPLWYEAELDEQQGACDAEEARVRSWLTRDPDDWYAYQYLARALAGQGRPEGTVLAALQQKWARLEAGHRPKIEPIDRALLASLGGDFTEAEGRLKDLEDVLAGEPGAQAHAESHVLLARIAEETGHLDRARDVAQAYLARKDAWAPSHRVDNVSIFLDPVPEMLGILGRAGAMPPARLASERGRWLDAWRAKTSAAYLGDLWLDAWAGPAVSPADGRAALDALPSFGGVPPFSPNVPGPSFLGHAYLLAGRTDDAAAALRRGTATCTALADPFASTRGWLDLGAALEAKGDRAGACSAYGVVVSRWGHARPRSTTAERAKSRVAALGCH
ncbi:MAG TPA: protein kinase, partial [Polyangiaceae bacterium]